MSSSESEQGVGGALTGMVRMSPNLWLLTAFRTCSSLASDRVPMRACPGVSTRPFRVLKEMEVTVWLRDNRRDSLVIYENRTEQSFFISRVRDLHSMKSQKDKEG